MNSFSEKYIKYYFIVPVVTYIFIVALFPLLFSIYMSFSKWAPGYGLSFIGITNFIDASVVNKDKVFCQDSQLNCNTEGMEENSPVKLAIRPESIVLSQGKSSEQNSIEGIIRENEFLGSFQRLYVESQSLSEELLMIDITNTSLTDFHLTPGSMIHLILPPDQIKVYPRS